MATIITAVVGLVLAGATVAGVVTSAHNNGHPTKTNTANVKLYGSR